MSLASESVFQSLWAVKAQCDQDSFSTDILRHAGVSILMGGQSPV